MRRFASRLLLISSATAGGLWAQAAPAASSAPKADSGDTAWMLVATALVLLMTIPGLALFYGGLVKRKNVLSVLMQCFILVAAITVQWVVFGYSLAFSPGELVKGWLGNFDWAFLKGLFAIPRAILQSLAILRKFKPDVVVGVGGYASGPVVLAAWLLDEQLQWITLLGGALILIAVIALTRSELRHTENSGRNVENEVAAGGAQGG